MNSSLPKVSVITPTYNHELFIGRCIDSVLGQDYPNLELIIIDDGSSDGTADVVSQYSDLRIRYLSQSRRGLEELANSYNVALRASTGELVAIVEGDDFWPEDKLRTMVPFFRDSEVVLAYGLAAEVDAEANGKGHLPRRVRGRRRLASSIVNNDPVGTAVRYMMTSVGVDLIAASTAVIRRSALESIGGFQYVRNLCVTDYPTFLSLTLKGKFRFVDAVMGYRRRHNGSATYANVERIVTGARNYAEQFLDENGIKLTDAEKRQIELSWMESRFVKEFEQGRVQLFGRSWSQARKHFLASLSFARPLVSVAAVVGWLLSWVHEDLEWAFRLTGKADLGRPAARVAEAQSD